MSNVVIKTIALTALIAVAAIAAPARAQMMQPKCGIPEGYTQIGTSQLYTNGTTTWFLSSSCL